MTPAQLHAELFSQLADPFTGEALFDHLSDLVFFLKNRRSEYVVVNQTLVARCGCLAKSELIGRRADEVFPAPLGESYRAQDESVLRNGSAILNQLELHFYPTGGRGWCLTNKLPLFATNGEVVGLMGLSKDLGSNNKPCHDYAAVARAVQHIHNHFSEPLRVGELAAHVGLSGYQFEQRIRKIFQLTAGQLITYYVGYHQWIDLRNQIQQQQGSGFSLKRFNDTALDEGPLPLPLVQPLLMQKLGLH